MAAIVHFECLSCLRPVPCEHAPGLCPHCQGPLLARYDMQALRHGARRPPAHPAPDHTMRRYRAVLPDFEPLRLAEADTPMLQSRRFRNLWVKLENRSACGTGLVRGLGMAAAWHVRQGYGRLGMSCAGADAVALAASGAVFSSETFLFMPADTEFETRVRCEALGANVSLVAGDLEACAARFTEAAPELGCRDLSSPAHPLRIEGDKTVGYEIAEYFGWTLPDAILCPPAAALALTKAFEELNQLDWLDSRGGSPATAPRLIVTTRPGAPQPDSWAAQAARATDGGWYVAAPEEYEAQLAAWPREEGFLLSPEGAAAAACYHALCAAGTLSERNRVVLIDNGEAEASLPLLARLLGSAGERPLPARMPVGGIITPQ